MAEVRITSHRVYVSEHMYEGEIVGGWDVDLWEGSMS